MPGGIVWEGLADVRPRPGAEGFAANVMVLCDDPNESFQLVPEVHEHDCELIDVDVEREDEDDDA